MDPQITWLLQTLRAQDKTKAELARLLGVDRSVVSHMFREVKPRRIQMNEWALIKNWLGTEPPEYPLRSVEDVDATATVPVVGVIMERAWLEGPPRLRNKRIPPLPGSDFPASDQYALEVDDPTRDTQVVAEYIMCVPIAKIGRSVRANDYVHCERHRDGLKQTVLRQVVQRGNQLKLQPRDSLETTSMDEFEIVGLVIGRFEKFSV